MPLLKPVAPILILAGFLTVSPLSLRAVDSQSLRVGAAKVDIAPSELTGLNSFGPDFTSVHDPIFARALVLDNGATTAAIVALDVVEVGDTTPVRQRMQSELGIAVDHIIITASHDHNAPRVGSVTPGGLAHPQTPETLAFTAAVYDGIVAAVKQAKAALQPARVGLGAGSADLNVNRDEFVEGRGWIMGYNATRPSDKTVWVVKFETPAGEPIAIVYNYAVHSSISLGTRELSGDIAGAASRYVESRYNNKIVALYTLGPAGDQDPKTPRGGGVGRSDTPSPATQAAQGGPGGGARPQSESPEQISAAFEAMNAVGLVLAGEVVRVANGIHDVTASAHIGAGERIVPCPVKRGVNQLGDIKQAQVDSMNLHLTLIRLNDIAFAGVSGEVVTNIYWHLKRVSPLTNTIMVTIANDRVGYIADDAAYDTPIFEVNGTPLARGCAENAIVNNLVDLINQN